MSYYTATICVAAGGSPLLTVDADGGMIAPETAADRLMVIAVLSQAIAHLAAAPLDDSGEDLAEPVPETAQ